MHHHPLRGIKHEGVCKLDAVQRPAQLGAEVRRAGVGCVHMEPQSLCSTCTSSGFNTIKTVFTSLLFDKLII